MNLQQMITLVRRPNVPIPEGMKISTIKVLEKLIRCRATIAEGSTNAIVYHDDIIPPEMKPAVVIKQMLCQDQNLAYFDYRSNCMSQVRDAAYTVAVSRSIDPLEERPGVLNIPDNDHEISRILKNLTESPKFNWANDWASVYVPSGGITQPHFDYCTSSQYMCHISGQKLWLMWPCTAENLIWILSQGMRNRSAVADNILDAIDTLSGLELHWFDKPQAFTVLPMRIHAVITIRTAVHTGFQYQTSDNYDENISRSRFVLKQVRNWRGDGISKNKVEEIYEEMVDDLEKLKDCFPSKAKEIAELITSCKDILL